MTFDLNLLRVLAAVIEEGTVTAAAERLQVSQPAITHGLNRLRRLTRDEIFVKQGRGVVPTRVALQLYSDTVDLVRAGESAIDRVMRFDPLTTSASFRVALTDVGQRTFLPTLVAGLQAQAPHARLVVSSPNMDEAAAQLSEGELDLAVMSTEVHGAVRSERLRHDHYVCVARRGTFGPKGPSRDEVVQRPRVVISSVTGHTLVERDLPDAPPGSVHTESFAGIPALLVAADLIAFVPDALRASWGSHWNIEHWPAPVDHARVRVMAHLPQVPRTRASSWFGDFAVSLLRDSGLRGSINTTDGFDEKVSVDEV